MGLTRSPMRHAGLSASFASAEEGEKMGTTIGIDLGKHCVVLDAIALLIWVTTHYVCSRRM